MNTKTYQITLNINLVIIIPNKRCALINFSLDAAASALSFKPLHIFSGKHKLKTYNSRIHAISLHLLAHLCTITSTCYISSHFVL